MNGANCTEWSNTVNCICRAGFTGETCEVREYPAYVVLKDTFCLWNKLHIVQGETFYNVVHSVSVSPHFCIAAIPHQEFHGVL